MLYNRKMLILITCLTTNLHWKRFSLKTEYQLKIPKNNLQIPKWAILGICLFGFWN
jgi:hypothetical protein